MKQPAFKILYSESLKTIGLSREFEQATHYLEAGNFQNIEVRKLTVKPYYWVKLKGNEHLLFKPVNYQEKPYLLLLEVLDAQSPIKSRFLRGFTQPLASETISNPAALEVAPQDTLRYLNGTSNQVHYLDRFIVFDDVQSDIFHYPLPWILIGSAGSGKTSLVLEKLKTLEGNLLYVTLSPYLVHNARRLYYSGHYEK